MDHWNGSSCALLWEFTMIAMTKHYPRGDGRDGVLCNPSTGKVM
jgi:hypothetical protein